MGHWRVKDMEARPCDGRVPDCSGRERLTKRTRREMCGWPGELKLFVAVEHRSDAHQLETDDGVVVVVFDGVPLGRLERLGRRSLRRTYV